MQSRLHLRKQWNRARKHGAGVCRKSRDSADGPQLRAQTRSDFKITRRHSRERTIHNSQNLIRERRGDLNNVYCTNWRQPHWCEYWMCATFWSEEFLNCCQCQRSIRFYFCFGTNFCQGVVKSCKKGGKPASWGVTYPIMIVYGSAGGNLVPCLIWPHGLSRPIRERLSARQCA